MLKVVETEIRHVPPHLVQLAWVQLQRSFRRAQGTALGDRMDELVILKALCEGEMELLTATRGEEIMGGIIIQFVDRPRGSCCKVVVSLFNTFHNRSFPDWSVPMNAHLIDYAKRERGCYTLEAYARDGVVPELVRLGWRRKATVMEMV
jgi:hypothetical protein